MAIAGLGAAHESGVAVPADLSLVAWEDSPLCRFVSPPLTVVEHDIAAFGAQAARLLFARLEGARRRGARSGRRIADPAQHGTGPLTATH